jgi:hypothetical protein
MNIILQKRIVKAARDYSDHNYIDEGVEVPAFIEGADFALKNQWISVEEALPKDNKVVFYRALSDKGTKCYGSAYVYNKEWYSDIDSAAQNYYHYKITHWMPIPELKGCEK